MRLNRRHIRQDDQQVHVQTSSDACAKATLLPLNATSNGTCQDDVPDQIKGRFMYPRRTSASLSMRWELSAFANRVRSLPRKKRTYILLIVGGLAIAAWPISILLFGPRGSPIGGVLGKFVDLQLRRYLLRNAAQEWEQELKDHGITLPPPPSLVQSNAIKTLPNVALGQVMLLQATTSKESQLDDGSVGLTGKGMPSAVTAPSQVAVEVRVSESPDAQQLNLVRKISIQEQMRERRRCEPNWLCFRCLKAPPFGSYEKCFRVCGTCSRDLICRAPYRPARGLVNVQVRIAREKDPVASLGEARLIPRIIHQTWFEELAPDRYPQLVRLQNSWKSSGWEYRFYDDDRIQEYIRINFPPRFLYAFQSLVPGAYKADLFRYLVLMKDGGVYADIDVMLDTNLDRFVGPDLGFFSPRDAVGEQVRDNFCLWNGLVGSAPGHPFMVQAVERTINLVLNRADFYDMEREICRSDEHQGETWKSRIEPNLLLSGPCALGVSVNEAMGDDPVAKFGVGWVHRPTSGSTGAEQVKIPGATMILALDKNDLGALRMSDVERNVIVASTDMPGLTKTPIEAGPGSEGSPPPVYQRPPHYSIAGRGDYLWGTKYVYSDALTANEELKMILVD